jgi:hypothetical protein
VGIPGGGTGMDRVREYFASQDWPVQPVGSGPGVNWAYRGENGEWYGQTWWFDEVEQLLVYSVCPLPIPEPTRPGIADLVLAVNSELLVGCLEFDMDSGQVRFRTGLGVARDELTDALIDRAVRSNVLTLDRYLPALVRAAAGVPAAEALSQTTGSRPVLRPS